MTAPDFSFENTLWKKGLRWVAGGDEVGRGSFAGPVVASVVVFEKNFEKSITISTLQGTTLQGKNKIKIDDSKKLSEKQRKVADKWIRNNALAFGIGQASVTQINKFGIKKATEVAFRKAVRNAEVGLRSSTDSRQLTTIEHLLVDAFFVKYLAGVSAGSIKKYEYNSYTKVTYGLKQTAIVNGDSRSFSVASASIIAKVYRDNVMEKLSTKKGLAVYQWFKNKGYGTKSHRDAISKYGISKHHRTQFVKSFLNNP